MKDFKKIEPKILPLVTAINNTKICATFSSCEGHFSKRVYKFTDHSKADVRFDPSENISLERIEHFVTYLMTEFNYRNSFTPITLYCYKLFAPDDNYEPDFVFVVVLEPFNNFDSPIKKRLDIDKAILSATEIVDEYKKAFL